MPININLSFFDLICNIILIWLLVRLIIIIFKGIWVNWLGHKLGYGIKWKGGHKSWAIITGSTDGLGLEFARQIAEKGYSLLLISQNEDKLERTRAMIRNQYPKCGKIKILAVDLSRTDIYDKIKETIDSLTNNNSVDDNTNNNSVDDNTNNNNSVDNTNNNNSVDNTNNNNSVDDTIDILINNCGVSYRYPEYLNKIPSGESVIENIININVLATTKLIQLVLPRMERQHSGIIVNVSSLSAITPLPLLSVYCASKTYVDYLAQALHCEYKSKGIIIQSLLPGYVTTKMSQIRQTSLFVPAPKQYIRAALNSLGVETRTHGFWAHRLVGFLKSLFNQRIYMFVACIWLHNVRTRYLKKYAKNHNNNNNNNCNNNNSNNSNNNCNNNND